MFSPDLVFTARSKLYTADLESGLHYLLRVELAAHQSLAGAALKTLKDFVTVLAKVRGQPACAAGGPAPPSGAQCPDLWGRGQPGRLHALFCELVSLHWAPLATVYQVPSVPHSSLSTGVWWAPSHTKGDVRGAGAGAGAQGGA